MINLPNREHMLKLALDKVKDSYDFIIIDCSPSLGLITVNALTAADSVMIPVQCEYFALEGLGKLLNTIKIVQGRLNPELEILIRRKDRSYFFSIYQFKEFNSPLTHFLYQNQYDGEYLLPEFKHMDFLWLMKYDFVDDDKCDWIKQIVRNLSGVQLVAEMTPDQIKNKGNMVF